MTQYGIRVTEDQRYQVYRTEDAIHKTDVGGDWGVPADAVAFVDDLEAKRGPYRPEGENAPR